MKRSHTQLLLRPVTFLDDNWTKIDTRGKSEQVQTFVRSLARTKIGIYTLAFLFF